MAKYTVYLTTTASLAVEVEVDDDLDPDAAKEQAIEEAFEKAPSQVCAQCGGWGKDYSLDLAEWEIETDHNGKEVEPERRGG